MKLLQKENYNIVWVYKWSPPTYYTSLYKINTSGVKSRLLFQKAENVLGCVFAILLL